MRNLFAITFLVLGSLAVAAPVPKEVRRGVGNLEGTSWKGDGVVGPTTYTFEKGGTLIYQYSDVIHTAGSWSQDGNKIYWETCSKYCEFNGTFDDGEMTGHAHNQPGGQWDLKMVKVK